jgi:hypothetical protein
MTNTISLWSLCNIVSVICMLILSDQFISKPCYTLQGVFNICTLKTMGKIVPLHTIKIYRGSEVTPQIILNLSTTPDMSDQLHTPATSLPK